MQAVVCETLRGRFHQVDQHPQLVAREPSREQSEPGQLFDRLTQALIVAAPDTVTDQAKRAHEFDNDVPACPAGGGLRRVAVLVTRSEEHTSELQSLMRISYAVFCLKKKKK